VAHASNASRYCVNVDFVGVSREFVEAALDVSAIVSMELAFVLWL